MSGLLSSLRLQRGILRERGLRGALRLNTVMLSAQLASWRVRNKDYYREISETELRALKSSQRAFVFGSGYSLNDITREEWREMSERNTIGFNAFVHQQWIKVDFHLVRGWGEASGPDVSVREAVEKFGSLVTANPLYHDTVFICQDDYTAVFAHRLMSYRGLTKGARVFRYHTNRTRLLPTRTFSDGLVHGTGTLCDAVDFAACMGFTEIVLVGVDLYDSQYFWLDPAKTIAVDYETGEWIVRDTTDRGQRFDEPHSTATNGVVELMATWHNNLREHGIQLSVYNPKSLLADVMPTYERGRSSDSRRHVV